MTMVLIRDDCIEPFWKNKKIYCWFTGCHQR